jgi:hypothetical protein
MRLSHRAAVVTGMLLMSLASHPLSVSAPREWSMTMPRATANGTQARPVSPACGFPTAATSSRPVTMGRIALPWTMTASSS